MSNSPGRGDPDLPIVEDLGDIGVDDEAHGLVVGGRPQQPELTVPAQELDRAATDAERDRRARERWGDVRDARRAIGI